MSVGPRAGRLGIGGCTLIAALTACSPGVGRTGETANPDAAAGPMDTGRVDPVADDLGVTDAAREASDASDLDASASDGGVDDGGSDAKFAFTGVFGILNDAAPLYAREVDGLLMLVVGTFPYVYFGTIDPSGEVDATGTVLEASGCPAARITGRFERSTATFNLVHATCNAQLVPVQATIRGGFGTDYEDDIGGIYDLTASVVLDLSGCYAGPNPVTVRYAFNQLGNLALQAFTVGLGAPTAYFGQLRSTFAGAILQRWLTADGASGVSMEILFGRPTANQPMQLEGTQDVYDAAAGCTYRVALRGRRVSEP